MKTRRVTDALLRKWPLPDPESLEGKEARGRVLIVGGSQRIPGAAILAADAALRAGAGKLQVATSRSVAMAVAVALPEAKVTGIDADSRGEIARLGAAMSAEVAQADAVLVGPGMEATVATHRVARTILQHAKSVVLDAGAMNGAIGHGVGSTPVITPHWGEMAGLLDIEESEVADDPIEIAQAFARAHQIVVVLKSANTVIANPDGKVWVHTRGCTGLGTSGSGDVLAGLICGLVAQGVPPDQAAVWGVALHGRAGERLSIEVGTTGFLAREIPRCVPAIRDAMRAAP